MIAKSITLSENNIDFLEKESAKLGISISEIIRRLVDIRQENILGTKN
jgi:hypothetical protein